MSSATGQVPGVRIGWSWRDVTPPRPNAMRGQFYVRVSQGTADPITVTAMAIESTDPAHPAQAIMVSCDFVCVAAETQESVREELRRRLPDFGPRMLVMNCTHTHSAPTMKEGAYPPQGPEVMTPTEYAALFVPWVAEAAEEAWKNRRPAGVSWAFSQAVVGHNRRTMYLDGTTRMYGKTNVDNFDAMEGSEDHGLNLLFVWDERRKLTGLVVNLSCPSQVSEHSQEFTADYWCETRAELRRRLGPELFILPQCAPAGDQSPHLLLYGELEKAMLERKGISQRQEIANRIAHGAAEVLAVARDGIQYEVPFRHLAEQVSLPPRMVTAEEFAEAQADLARIAADQAMEASHRFVMTGRARQVMARYQSQQKNPEFLMELHVMRLGDVAVATNTFELFLDFGLRIKARSRATQNFLVQLAAGSSSYLPTARAVRGRSYGAEVASNHVGPEGGQVLVNRTVELINGLWP